MHTDFDGQRFLCIIRQAGPFGGKEAEQIADAVVEYDNRENQQAAFNNLAFAGTDDCADNQHDGGNGNQRQRVGQFFSFVAQDFMDNQAQNDGEQNHFDDGHQHTARLDFQHFTGKHQEDGGGQQWGNQGGNRCNGNRQSHIAARQISHYIGSRTARAAADQNHTDCDFGRQVQQLGQQIGSCRHDGELCNHADDDGFGAFEQNIEVGRFERQAHAEHDDAQKPRNVRADPFEGVGCGKSDAGKERRPKGKCFSNKVADFIEDTHDNML